MKKIIQANKKYYSFQSPTSSAQSVTLDECFKLFTCKEQLSKDNAWYCSKCKDFKEATKQITIWRLPPILVIQFKRFEIRNNFWNSKKKDDFISYPVQAADFSMYESCPPHVSAEFVNHVREQYVFGLQESSDSSSSYVPLENSPPIYDLYAVSIHSGGTLGGHYTAYAYSPAGLEWSSCNDSYVTSLSGTKTNIFESSEQDGEDTDDATDSQEMQNRVVTGNAYILFYKRRGIKWDISLIEMALEEGERNFGRTHSSSAQYNNTILTNDDEEEEMSSSSSSSLPPSAQSKTVDLESFEDISAIIEQETKPKYSYQYTSYNKYSSYAPSSSSSSSYSSSSSDLNLPD